MVTKQCSKCAEMYDYDVGECPACGYKGYKLADGPAAVRSTGRRRRTASGAVPCGAVAEHRCGSALRAVSGVIGVCLLASLFLPWTSVSDTDVSYAAVVFAAPNTPLLTSVPHNTVEKVKLGFEGKWQGALILPMVIPLLVLGLAVPSRQLSLQAQAVGVAIVGAGGTILAWLAHVYIKHMTVAGASGTSGVGLLVLGRASVVLVCAAIVVECIAGVPEPPSQTEHGSPRGGR